MLAQEVKQEIGLKPLRQVADEVCEKWATSVQDIIDDLRSMRIIPCCGVHQRKGNPAPFDCPKRTENLACLHPDFKGDGHVVRHSPAERISNYIGMLAKLFTVTKSESLAAKLGITGSHNQIWEARNAMRLPSAMTETNRSLYLLDRKANELHRKLELPMADACSQIGPEQIALAGEIEKYRDEVLDIFLNLESGEA